MWTRCELHVIHINEQKSFWGSDLLDTEPLDTLPVVSLPFSAAVEAAGSRF